MAENVTSPQPAPQPAPKARKAARPRAPRAARPRAVANAPAVGPTWVRIRDKDTGHEYDIAPRSFRADAHQLLNARHYPDLYGSVRPRPAKHRSDKGQTATNPTQES